MKPNRRSLAKSKPKLAANKPVSVRARAKFNEGFALHQKGQLAQAQELYQQVLKIQPLDFDALHMSGVIAYQTGNHQRAVDLIGKAIEIDPNNAVAYSNRGVALNNLKQHQAAVDSYDKAIAIKPDYADAYTNRANALNDLKQHQAAIDSCDKAIAIRPDYAGAYVNRGNALNAMKQHQAALESFNRAIALRPDFAEAYNNRGFTLNALKRHQAAIDSYDKAIALKPDYEFLYGMRLHIKMHICDWHDFGSQVSNLLGNIEHNEKATPSLPVLALTSSLSLQRKAAEIWVNNMHPTNLCLGAIPKRPRGQKIRIGYFSMDFSNHAASILTAELFETHTRSAFEIYAFSFGQDPKDEMRLRLERAFDKFIDVKNSSDEEIAKLSREIGIDIAIDLGGLTNDSRPDIFALRAAPIQVNYIGYPGTMGAPYIDYIIADRQVIPEQTRAQYAEKVVYLPCFQANDSQRKISEKKYTRQKLGLPETGFVFCCFNNNYKINPGTFDGWIRILQQVQGSVLFLYADSETAAANLRAEAVRTGIDANRLVFGQRIPVPEYLARYRSADLFLDTYPFNGGATVSDALWAGLPVLTCTGEAFASRMASSLVNAIGLPELITATPEDYEALAIELAADPARLKAIKDKLARNRLTTPLFDTKLFTRHIEAAYTQMLERYHANLPPEHIDVGAKSIQTVPQAEHSELVALFNAGRHSELVSRARLLVEQYPDWGFAWKVLGASLRTQGKEALPVLQKAITLLPGDAEVHNSLANALQGLGRTDDAVANYRRALQIEPNYAQAHSNLGNALRDLGRLDDALVSYRRALAIKPDYAEAHNNLGNALRDLGRLDDAVVSYRRALAIKPDYAEPHGNLGNVLQNLGQLDNTVASYHRALALKPDYAEAHNNLGNALQDLGRFDEALASYRRALEIKPDFAQAHSNLLFTHNYLADQPATVLLAEARHFGELVARQARPYVAWPNLPARDRCLRVGLVSGDLRDHPVGFFVEGLLAALASSAADRLEVVAYTNHFCTDALTERLKACCHGWHSALGLSDDNLARRIREDGIDILIDLAGHTGHNRLPVFAWKPAPVQATWLGYFATTGVAAIDYLIADPWTLPQSEEAHFTEKIWRLPETRLCFTAPDAAVEVAPLPALSNGYITFGCFNNLSKMNDAVVALWARVLQAVPASRLFLKAKQLNEASVQQSILERFAVHGIAAGRMVLEGPEPRAKYLAAYQRVDIVLDPFPFPGGTTSAESLWMGVPVLSLTGERFLSRQGVGMLMNVGLPEWVAADADDYVARAMSHAGQLDRLATLRKGLRQQVLASPLMDAPRFARHFEAALRAMWTQWCKQQ